MNLNRRLILVFMVFVVAIACKPVTSLPVEEGFQWLEGEWVTSDGNSGEKWVYLASDDHMDGRAWKIEGGDTVSLETMQIVFRRDKLFFLAEPRDSGPVYFEITDSGRDYFVSENPYNDFPGKIEYRRNQKNLTAIISNAEREQKFSFSLK